MKKTETVTVAQNSGDLSFLSEGKTVLVHALEGAHNLEGENIRKLRRKYPFGSDFDGFSDPPDDIADASEWHYLRDYLACQYRLLNDTIEKKYSDEQLEQFFWKNALETLKNGWTA